jgi:soluble cytochrome b562
MPKKKAQAETEQESESPPAVDVEPESPEIEGFRHGSQVNQMHLDN